ncbi:unnamed protein product [Chondrus crispus]|uniref:Uncharacterized protein n=1 Tax=Chondrus crispus TaxID=2769 RepID=R7QQS7_CHOCR|nr:unnamed protein product [Chondrus crispus]CDF40093.1 unnamed protein product [Chondrus crispus]|eukprot:XP_005710387.1 unnamed protein product [Chondrus crispus]
MSGVSRGTAFPISQSHKTSDHAALERLMDPERFPRGRRNILHSAEESLIVDRFLVAARDRFDVDKVGLTSVSSRQTRPICYNHAIKRLTKFSNKKYVVQGIYC